MKVTAYNDWESSFDEAFFLFAAECGVRSIRFESDTINSLTGIGLLPALSFGFAEPAAGGDRSISGVDCETDDENFLAHLVQVSIRGT